MVDPTDRFVEQLALRRDRTIFKVLSSKERNVDRFLPDEVAAEFRTVLMDEINDFAEVIRLLHDNVQAEV